MSLTPRLTLIGLYNFNNSLFSNLIFPEGVENDIFIDTLLMKYGECPLISPDLDYMILAIGAWSRKWYDNIERMYRAISADYNPIYNYDRFEKWEGTDDLTITGNDNRTITVNDSKTTVVNESKTIEDEGTIDREYGSTTEHKVSAYNESDYQEDNEDIVEGTDNTETGNTTEISGNNKIESSGNNQVQNYGTNSETRNGENAKDGHIYGNVGTTKSTEMVHDELELRYKYNLYDLISELFYHEFCLYVF